MTVNQTQVSTHGHVSVSEILQHRFFNYELYCNKSKYWDWKAFANKVDPDKQHLIREYTVCHTYSNILDTSRVSRMDMQILGYV